MSYQHITDTVCYSFVCNRVFVLCNMDYGRRTFLGGRTGGFVPPRSGGRGWVPPAQTATQRSVYYGRQSSGGESRFTEGSYFGHGGSASGCGQLVRTGTVGGGLPMPRRPVGHEWLQDQESEPESVNREPIPTEDHQVIDLTGEDEDTEDDMTQDEEEWLIRVIKAAERPVGSSAEPCPQPSDTPCQTEPETECTEKS